MRQTSLTIDLGGEQVRVRRVEASETLGRPFSIVIDIVAPLGPIDLLPHLGKPASVTVYQDDKLMRHYHGIVVEGAYVSERDDGHSYRIWLRPWTYLASQNRDYAIFQEKTVVEIAKEVYGDLGFAKVDYGKLSKSRQKREYCVQYGESDFAFVTRLMEEEGIYYYFEHTADEHVMVLCEAPASHVDGKPPLLTYNSMANSVANVDSAIRATIAKRDYIHSWTERVSTGAEAKVVMRDYDFTKTDKVEAVATAKAVHPQDEIEVFRFPARFLVESDGKTLGEARLNALRANRQVFSGETQVESLACGKTFKIKDHPNARFNARYLVTAVQHVTSSESERSGSGEGGHVYIEAIPADTLFHMQSTVQRPSTRGLETAIVTGPSGEEIYTDKYGRVKVRFFWDRGTTPGEKSTCWIRVSQTGGLGNIILPRVGHEVIVDFIDGDPDRPIVTGRVFNSKNMPVYTLPDNKTRAVWRTKTYGAQSSYGAAASLDTKAPKANELRFEDKGGKEEVFLHAERDYNVRVRHCESHHIGLDQGIQIGGARDTKIAVTDTLDVKKSIKITAGTTIDIEAGAKITLKVGDSKIEIDPTSIKMKTTLFKVEATATADVKSAMTTVKGDAMLTLKGGMTLIN
jgi:type VI secretion system secreted protein VgrG